jgi:hypothetical protein
MGTLNIFVYRDTQLNSTHNALLCFRGNSGQPFAAPIKALLHGQKDHVFFQQAFNLHTKTRAL